MLGMRLRPGRLALSTMVDPTKCKYSAITVMTVASTVLAKSVRFQHVQYRPDTRYKAFAF